LALIGAAVILVVIFGVLPTAPKLPAPARRAEAPPDPESDQLQLSGVTLTPSPVRDGKLSVRLAAQLQNLGGAAVTGATLEAAFFFVVQSRHVAGPQPAASAGARSADESPGRTRATGTRTFRALGLDGDRRRAARAHRRWRHPALAFR